MLFPSGDQSASWTSSSLPAGAAPDPVLGTVGIIASVTEPFCSDCWGGAKISFKQIEEMARYSKSIWPGLATIVRSPPTLLAQQNYRYLDVAWADLVAQAEAKDAGTRRGMMNQSSASPLRAPTAGRLGSFR